MPSKETAANCASSARKIHAGKLQFMQNTNKLCNEATLNYQKIKLDEFEKLLEDYLESDKASRFGLPNATYFSDILKIQTIDLEKLIKKQKDTTVCEYIDEVIINAAKLKIFDTSKSIN